MTETVKSKCGRIELRLGRWQDVLSDITGCYSLICDPPYTQRVVDGQPSNRNGIRYGNITKKDAEELADWSHERVNRWSVIFNDHIGWRWYEETFKQRGWYTFAPVVWCKKAAAPRMSGDGPMTSVEHILVARTKNKFQRDEFGSRPGFYIGLRAILGSCGNNAVLIGGKPLEIMQEVIKDYSRPGDLIVDPYAGGATTLIAAAIEGRRAIGAECDPETFAKAKKRILAGYTPSMFVAERKSKDKQAEIPWNEV